MTALNIDFRWKNTLAGAFDEWVQDRYKTAKEVTGIESGSVFDSILDYSLLPVSGGYLINRDFLKGVNAESHLGLDPNQPLEDRIRNLTMAGIDIVSIALGVEQIGKQLVTSGARTVVSREAGNTILSKPELPQGYHYRSVGEKIQVVRNPGMAGELPQLHLEGGALKLAPVLQCQEVRRQKLLFLSSKQVIQTCPAG